MTYPGLRQSEIEIANSYLSCNIFSKNNNPVELLLSSFQTPCNRKSQIWLNLILLDLKNSRATFQLGAEMIHIGIETFQILPTELCSQRFIHNQNFQFTWSLETVPETRKPSNN